MGPAPILVPLHGEPGDDIAPLTPLRLLTGWTWDWWVFAGALVAVSLYLWGVWRLRRRGDSWSLGRTLAWCVGGVGSAVLATMSALGTYDTVLFSVHAVQHIVLAMLTPVMLALGAPVTLALRALPAGGHKALMAVLHSWVAKVAMFPPLATALMIANPFGLYLTDVYEFTLRNALAHDWLHLHFVLTGCMFFWPLLGLDPLPNRLLYPIRILLFFVTMPFHAFLGVTIMGDKQLIAEDWYLAFNRAWPPSPLDDQRLAGGIMWGAGDVIALVVIGVLFVQWWQESQREAKREDRRLDREEEAQRRRSAVLASPGAAGAAQYDAPDRDDGRGDSP